MKDPTDELSLPSMLTARDARAAASMLGNAEIRYLVDRYYAAQEDRKSARNQERAAAEAGEPIHAITWLAGVEQSMEDQIKRLLDRYTADYEPIGISRWARSIVGIGPVLAAGFAAHIGDHRTVSALWSFAGLNPAQEWKRGEKRPWNASLKLLQWKAGESFVKTSGHSGSFYGPIYEARKRLETDLNETGAFAEQARAILTTRNFGADTVARQAYEAGKLPPAHVHARAKRYAVKMFLSHYWIVRYELTHPGETAPDAYILTRPSHTHKVPPPNWPM